MLRAYGVRCMGRLWAEMRREFLSCCVMSIYPCSDGGFPNNGVEAEGQKAMTVNKKKTKKKPLISMDMRVNRRQRDLERWCMLSSHNPLLGW